MIISRFNRGENGTHIVSSGTRISVKEKDILSIICQDIRGMYQCQELYGDGPEYVVAESPWRRWLILGESSVVLWLAQLESNSAVPIDLKRQSFFDKFWRQDFMVTDDALLFVFEGGCLKFDSGFNLKWRIDHARWDWYFVGISEGEVQYESEEEGRWAYSLETGEKI